MSMYLEFEPHSWYMGFAIRDNRFEHRAHYKKHFAEWEAFIDNGNTYRIDQVEAGTLKELKNQIKQYHIRHKNGYSERMKEAIK